MRIFLTITLIIISYYASVAQKSLFSSILQDSIVEVFLTLDWKALEKNKAEKIYQDGRITFVRSPGDTVNMELKVRSRGNMRLKICAHPPIKLKFDKALLTKQGFSEHNEIDLVNPCEGGNSYEQYVLKEYLAYKLYNIISPVSYSTQLIRLHYINDEGKEVYDPVYGFLVENTNELTERLNGKRSKVEVMSQNAVDKSCLLRVCLFEFMIGNTDWFIQNKHNLEFLLVADHNLLVPVPYDFDYSGLVNAPYAIHHESIALPSVTDRYYQGKCASEEEINKAIAELIGKKELLLAMCRKIPGMDLKSVEQAEKYLLDFFEIIENPKKRENQIIRHCNMWPKEN